MDRERLLELTKGCVTTGEVVLASGKTSDFYVDARLVTISGEGSALVGEAVLQVAKELGATAIGGPTTAACPMITAAGLLAHQQGTPMKLFFVRSAAKGHGLQKRIEGPPLSAEDKVLIVDDTMTSGGSLLKAIVAVKEEIGCEILAAYCLVDRESGGRETLEQAGITMRAEFTRADLKA